MINKFKEAAKTSYENLRIRIKRKREVNKFRVPERVKIYSEVELSSEQKQQIDDIYIANYGERIPYTWHRHFTAFTGHFDPQYLPEMLYIPEFERFENLNKDYSTVLEDKNFFPAVVEHYGIKTPHAYLTCTYGIFRDEKGKVVPRENAVKVLSGIGEVFIKPTVGTNSGRNCAVLQMKDGVDELSGKTAEEIISTYGRNFTVQERVVCHESLRKLYSDSVNTFRIISYRWKDRFYTAPSVLKVGTNGGHMDNSSAGGIFIAVDDDGKLHDKAFTEFNNQFTVHPDTGTVFEGYSIPLFTMIREKALYLHSMLPQVGSANWDITVDSNGDPVLIESNISAGSIWFSEMAHGKGPFGERTGEILRWMKYMKKASYSERREHLFGEM